MNDWHQTLSSGTLLLIAAAAIALILLMIIRWRVHALLTLTVVSLLTALATGIPAQAIVNDVLLKNLGSTLGGVAILVSLGAMLGRLVETSGGAQSLADAMIRTFGEKRAPFALGVASLLFGFPIFFACFGLILINSLSNIQLPSFVCIGKDKNLEPFFSANSTASVVTNE